MTRIPRLVALFCLLVIPTIAASQAIPFDSDRWEITGQTAVQMDYNGRKALYLYGAQALLKDADIEDGVIEFDVAFSAERGFSGVFWRLDESGNQEEFYLRPHQSGNPDANQYNPVLNGVAAWQLYYGPSYAAPIRYRFNEWMHVRVVFSGSLADIYVDSEKPVLTVHLKNAPIAGQLGVYASNFAPAYFANFEFHALDGATIVGTPVPEAAPPAGAVMEWSVSNTFADSILTGEYDITESFQKTLSWTSVMSESTGIVNLARYAVRRDANRSVLVKKVLNSDADAVRMLRFGYSDRASVYLNGRLLYRGSNDYQSRDYRYLGTIGLFDEVPLRLRRGKNELVIAVSESFGGWGVLAALD